MSQILTTRQAEELHKSMVAYLSSLEASKSTAALREELVLPDTFDDATCKKFLTCSLKANPSKDNGLSALQILDLESKVAGLQAELSSLTLTSRSKGGQDPDNWLPGPASTRTFESHRDAITCIAFHPIFTSLASSSEDCTIKIWDWELGELERTLKGHIRAVTGLDFGGQKGNTLLASCSSDLTVKLWDPSKGYANIRTLSGHDHSVSAVRFLTSTENLLVSAGRDASIRIWDVSTGYWGRDQAVTVWEVATAEQKSALLGHENYIECCVIAPPTSYEHLATLAGLKKPPAPSSSCEFIATGARDKTIRLWESRGRLIKTLVGHDNWVRDLVFHPNGKHLISVADDKTIRCWDLSQEGKLVKTIDNAHSHFVTCMRWGPSATTDVETTNGVTNKGTTKSKFQCVIATGSADSCVRVFS
uniref:Nuclear distribution protein nudF 2 n=1 Tax=Talaromyces marneffei PM1 TaxID=1077442 RepID=A0A093VFP4_TALMA